MIDETTNNTIAFALYELASHPELQERLREEVREALRRKRERVVRGEDVSGDVDVDVDVDVEGLGMADMDRLELGGAFLKVSVEQKCVFFSSCDI